MGDTDSACTLGPTVTVTANAMAVVAADATGAVDGLVALAAMTVVQRSPNAVRLTEGLNE